MTKRQSEHFPELPSDKKYVSMVIITVKYTTISIMRDIFKTDRLINKNAQLLSRSGSKSALYRFM
jgi:hypothetical protein